MSFVRNVWADLVEKRLWPAAAVLVLALIAVPIVLPRMGGSDTTAPIPPAPVTAVAPAPPGAAFVKVEAQPAERTPASPAHDPFQHGSPLSANPTAPAASAAPAPAASAAAAGSGAPPAATSAPASSGVAPKPRAVRPAVSGSTALTGALSTARLPAEPRSGPAAGYRIDLRLSGEGRRWSLLDVYRLAPLGTTRSGPLVVFLGVRGDKHTAVFAVAGKSVNTGAGRCLPTRADCQVIELRKGHTEFLDTVVDDQVVRYRLTVDAIAQRHASTRARAARVLRRRSRAGEKIVSALVASGHTYVDRYEYSRLRGIVIRHDAATASSRPPVAAGALIPAQ